MTDGRERVVLAKYSTSRSRANCMKTDLSLRDGEIVVRKTPLACEAADSLHEMYTKKGLLTAAFPDGLICPCHEEEKSLVFEYIHGNSLANTYWCAFQKNDFSLFYSNIERHKALLFSNPENRCVFVPSKEFEDAFGPSEDYVGLPAVKRCNFEATAFNIIYDENSGEPVFFDYECIYDFPIPEDLVKYHCIYRTLYLCMPFLSSFVSPEDFLSRLELQTDRSRLEKSWKCWRNVFSFGEKSGEKDLPAVSAAPAGSREGGASVPNVTLAAVKKKYSIPFSDSGQLDSFLTALRRRQALKEKIKARMPAPVFKLLKRVYRFIKHPNRK